MDAVSPAQRPAKNSKPVPGAWLDFPQVDSTVTYDTTVFLLRGSQNADTFGDRVATFNVVLHLK
ncbi:MAG: hypothetical protein EXR44_02915 [Dehalococcoidia bacterium]|nr:hypothetical protein [Dehalococcoidia bacterium]